MLIVGLTGGIGSGKSTATRFFSELDVRVIDADDIARDVASPGQPGLQAIIEHFGANVLTPQGVLDRAKLRTIAFSDAAQRAALEAILHPLIRHEIQSRLKILDAPYCIVMIPLLLETQQQDLVQRILVVDCDEAEQIARVRQRSGLCETEVRAIMSAQMPRQQRLMAAQDVIHNNGDLEQLRYQVITLHQRYLQLSMAMNAES